MSATRATRVRGAVAARRTRVRHLADQGASLRDIAAAVGVSKDTVRRDLAVTRQHETAGATPAAVAGATDETPLVVVPLTASMADDLAVIRAAGGYSERAAVRLALTALANSYRRKRADS